LEYKITPSDDAKYVTLTAIGEINRNIAIQANLEAHALGKKMGVNRYLIDVTEARNTDSTVDSYDFAYNDMRKLEGIDQFARVAVLNSPGDSSHDFIVTVCRNAGLNVTQFTDPKQAKEFLTT